MAFTISNINKTLMGNFLVYLCKVRGDGADTTISIPMKKAVAAFTTNIDDTSAIPGVSVSDNVVTYAAAPTSTKFHYLMVIGTP